MERFLASVVEMVCIYEAKCPWKHRNKTMKEYVAQGDSFLVTDKRFLANIVTDILNSTFQFVGLGDISAGKVEEVSSTKSFQLKCSHQYHTQVQHAMFVCQKKYTDFHVYLPKESFVQRITAADDYGKNLPKLEKFFDYYTAPEMFSKQMFSKQIASTIIKGIMDSICG